MNTHNGFIIKCSCGRVISQCRCICKDKRVEVHPHPACGMEPLQPPVPAETALPVALGMTPHRCPICAGNGIVDAGFYSQPGTQQTWVSGNTTPEECRSCKGSGIIWTL